MRKIFALALITYKEGVRNRSLFGIGLLALFLLGLNVSVAGFFMRDIGKVTVDMNLTALSLSGLLLIFFVGVNLMSKDIDRKTIQLVLSKPLSRPQYICGKYLGIVFFVTVSLFLLIVLSFLTVLLLKTLYPDYFNRFLWLNFSIACLYSLFRLWLIAAIVVFFSSITTSSLITLIFSIASYIAGATIEDVIFYVTSEISVKEMIISDSLRTILDLISYVVPNLSVFDFTLEAAHGLPVSLDRLLLVFGYGSCYIVILLLAASLIFSRREFN